jgi:hypothetical protein
MRNIFIAVLVLSVLAMGFSAINLLDTYTSLKYEVDEPIAMGKSNEFIMNSKKHLTTIIIWLWVFAGYSITICAVSLKALMAKK